MHCIWYGKSATFRRPMSVYSTNKFDDSESFPHAQSLSSSPLLHFHCIGLDPLTHPQCLSLSLSFFSARGGGVVRRSVCRGKDLGGSRSGEDDAARLSTAVRPRLRPLSLFRLPPRLLILFPFFPPQHSVSRGRQVFGVSSTSPGGECFAGNDGPGRGARPLPYSARCAPSDSPRVCRQGSLATRLLALVIFRRVHSRCLFCIY